MTRYPAELEEHWDAAGEHLTIRPVRRDDAERLRAFFGRLTPEDIRLRFFAAIRELTPAQLKRFTQIDYERDMAFAAIRDATDETVGVARLARDDDTGIEEFAVVVQQDVKGKGLGTHLMRRLIEWARRHGIAEIRGEILAENTNMLIFARNLGFTLRHAPSDPEIVEARLVLGPQ
ncbi:MAG TPA: GNAT family N-acetyltransferase [Acetobacteraceae bacterium]|nr:GNAT family N-acetyltransferase [Acetobacteraceae bacterium]